ncbi:MAG: hypothetical protein ABIT36_03530, partial [Steroidobacteraceae bacterium]
VAFAPATTAQANCGDKSARGAVVDVPIYQIDSLVRRAASLQKSREGRVTAVTYGDVGQGA